jgi:hypothetical protein
MVEDEFSDTQLAELFMHFRVFEHPGCHEGRVHAIVTRSEFFRHLVERFIPPEGAGACRHARAHGESTAAGGDAGATQQEGGYVAALSADPLLHRP